MSHEFTSGVFMNDKAAWHRLGQVVAGTLSAPEAFQRAGALFPVELIQLWAGNPLSDDLINEITQHVISHATDSGELRANIREAITSRLVSMQDTRVGIWRTDERKVLGTAGPEYKVIPNQRLLDFANAIREEVEMDTVIVLRGGAKVAFTAKIRGTDREVVPGDRVFRNIVGYLGHDGSTAFGGMFSDIRVVCANTLGFAQSSANRHGRQFTIRHTEVDVSQIDQIIGNIDFARQSFQAVVDDYAAMRDVPMTLDLYRSWLEQVYQVPDKKLDNGDKRPGRIDDMPRKWAQLEHAWNYGLGRDIPGVANTLYAGINAVTEVETSQLTKGAGKRRMHSALFGSGASVVKRANELARQLVAAGG